MNIRLYLDEDATSDGLAAALRAQGIDVRTTTEEGTQGRSDEEQLLYARTLDRVLYSFNQRDFMALHTRFLGEGASHSGIILAPQQRYPVGEQARRVKLIAEAISVEGMQNQVIFLGNWGRQK